MSTNVTTAPCDATAHISSSVPVATTAVAPEQLSFLASSGIPLQFRLDERTRRAGLAHVAALRAQIAAQAASRSSQRQRPAPADKIAA